MPIGESRFEDPEYYRRSSQTRSRYDTHRVSGDWRNTRSDSNKALNDKNADSYKHKYDYDLTRKNKRKSESVSRPYSGHPRYHPYSDGHGHSTRSPRIPEETHLTETGHYGKRPADSRKYLHPNKDSSSRTGGTMRRRPAQDPDDDDDGPGGNTSSFS